MTESEIRKIVKSVLSDEVDKLEKKINAIKDDVSKAKKEALGEDDIKKIVRKMIVNKYKWMWQKSSTYINQI